MAQFFLKLDVLRVVLTLKMMVVLDFLFKVSIISKRQFNLEKKQEVMPFCLHRWHFIFIILKKF